MTHDPIARVISWLDEAKAHPDIKEPTAMALATATPDGAPSVRMVLLKIADARGFVFFTNHESRKGEELHANPRAALCLFWQPLGRQVRIEGRVEGVSDAEADAYFNSRYVLSRLGAIASRQSRPLASREELVAKVKELEARYPDGDPPRPAHWSGFRVVPERIEFWQEGDYRLHTRELFVREELGWRTSLLHP